MTTSETRYTIEEVKAERDQLRRERDHLAEAGAKLLQTHVTTKDELAKAEKRIAELERSRDRWKTLACKAVNK